MKRIPTKNNNQRKIIHQGLQYPLKSLLTIEEQVRMRVQIQ